MTIQTCFYAGVFVLMMACVSHPHKASESSKLYADLGLAYLNKGDFELAEQKLEHAIGLYERNAEAHHYLAELYRGQGRALVAEEEYRRAIQLNKKDPSIWNNFGIFLCGEGRYDDADAWFLKAAKKKTYKQRGAAYENAGLCRLESENKILAKQYFKSSIGIESRAKALFYLALLSFESGDYKASDKVLKRYERYFDKVEKSLFLRVRLEQAMQHDALFRQVAAQLIKQFPNSIEAQKTKVLLE